MEDGEPGSKFVDLGSPSALTVTIGLGGSYPFPTSTMIQLELDQVGSKFCKEFLGTKITG